MAFNNTPPGTRKINAPRGVTLLNTGKQLFIGLFTAMRGVAIIARNKTRQGYVPRNILKQAGYFFLASDFCFCRKGGCL